MSDLCKCGQPKSKKKGACRECHAARMKERQRAEVAGTREVGVCPNCKSEMRMPGQSYCRTCKREKDMWRHRKMNGVKPENYQGHRQQRPKLRPGLHYCIGCARVLDVSQFRKAKSKSGIDWYCKLCRTYLDRKARTRPGYLKRRRELYRENREKFLQRNREWRAKKRLEQKLEGLKRVYTLKVRRVA